jgi:trk system potassium uptake protein TrkA
MKALIVGGGIVGQAVLEELEKNDVYCRVIERDARKCETIARKFGAAVYHGTGSDEGLLEIAGASEVDVLVACTDDDRTNLLAAKAAKEKFSVPRVVTRVNSLSTDIGLMSKYSDRLVVQGRLTVEEILRGVLQQNPLYIYREESSDLVVAKVAPPVRSVMIGVSLKDIAGDCHAVVFRDGKVLQPDDETPLMFKDVVILSGKLPQVESTARRITTTA